MVQQPGTENADALLQKGRGGLTGRSIPYRNQRGVLMNDVLKAIAERRSIRKYLPKPLPDGDLDRIVEAGLWAPSARNRQPWHLTVVTGLERISRVTAELKAAVARMPDNPYQGMVGAEAYTVNFHNAPVFIIVSADPQTSPLAAADCALVLQNIFLAAHSLGIGSCWVNQLGSACDEAGFRAFITELGVPEGHHIYGCTALGYADGPAPVPPARKKGAVSYAK